MENKEKEKIVLADGTEIEIKSGATERVIQVTCTTIEDFKETYEKFTEENLSSYQVKNAEDLVFAEFDEKYVKDVNLMQTSEGFLVTFHLEDVDKIKKAVDAAIDAYTAQLIEEGLI